MNSDTLLHRQVNPSWVQQGHITSQVFKPTPKDNRRLSVYDGHACLRCHFMPTDTTEKGLEDLIVAAMTEEAAPGAKADLHERPSIYAPGWLLGDPRDYNGALRSRR